MVVDLVCGETVTENMGRSPCCERLGLNKGFWSPEEDRILVNHINKHGHKNWHALPRQAGTAFLFNKIRVLFNVVFVDVFLSLKLINRAFEVWEELQTQVDKLS